MVKADTSHIDLDELEREDDPGPFTATLGGREYTLCDPQLLDHRELVTAIVAGSNGDLLGAMGIVLEEEDREEFWENKIPAFKLDALFTAYSAHYKLPSPGEANASDRSSGGTGRQSRPTSRGRTTPRRP